VTQRKESIDDQIASCRRYASLHNFEVDSSNIFTDEATSGARADRKGLDALIAASETGRFDVVLIDDLSRLARDNYLMLTKLAQLHFNGGSAVSVADGLDTEDSDSKLAIQIRGIFNLISYIAQGRSSEAVARALEAAEGRARDLAATVIALKASEEKIFEAPPIEWIAERVAHIQELLEQRVQKSALILRKLLGKIRLEPVQPDIGKPYLRATSTIQALSILEIKPGSDQSEPGHSMEPDDGSKSLRWWTLSQRIGTLAEIPFEVAVLDAGTSPAYQKIASKSFQLQQLGLSNSAIAKRLEVSDKTASKAISWLLGVSLHHRD